VELEKGIADADLFLGHGNMGSVVHSLEHGTPLAIIPIHQEQLLTGQRVHKTGAGVLIDRIESVEHLRDQINAALGSAELKQKAQQFQADNLPLLQQDLADTVVELCDRILGSAHSSA
jgi:UDP:flavonoid glycosyltransferase YjiC (YdhE family)